VSLAHAGINHDESAVESHRQNHPHAKQYHSKVEGLHPHNVVDDIVEEDVQNVRTDDVTVDLLTAGPECTHFSPARGGKPVSEQKRASPWTVLDWLEKLDVTAFIIENTPAIQSWGPVEDGEASRDGTIFDAWITVLNRLGYSVNWTTLNAKHFGDPTDRERFFLVGQKDGEATFPDPTHSDSDNSLPSPPTAADIIDWSDTGTSIWTRDLTEPRVHTPPKDTTLKRIAEGLRRHCGDALEPYADALEKMDRDTIRQLRKRLVPAEYAPIVAQAVDEPFLVGYPGGERAHSQSSHLVKYYGTSPPQSVDDPLDTVTADGGKYALSTVETMILRQQDGDGAYPVDVKERAVPTIPTRGGHSLVTTKIAPLIEPKNGSNGGLYSNVPYPAPENQLHTITADPRAKLVDPSLIRFSHGGATLDVQDPLPTVATERGGNFALSTPFLSPLYNGRDGQAPRTRTIDRPLMTVPASKSPAAVASPELKPFIDNYENTVPDAVSTPLKTITCRDKFALCVPEAGPWGIDINYRMLKPAELKRAQGFPEDYELVGTKTERTTQIGNAVPVNLARSLVEHVLTDGEVSLSSFGGGISEVEDVEVPDYQTVVKEVSGD
jgi:DNA (cytosine-5)-methyltransferase 1